MGVKEVRLYRRRFDPLLLGGVAATAAGLAAFLAIARPSSGQACGISYGVGAFLVKLVVSDVNGGLSGLFTNWADLRACRGRPGRLLAE
jgi:hypothetical protein